jgi:hypothetical protein
MMASSVLLCDTAIFSNTSLCACQSRKSGPDTSWLWRPVLVQNVSTEIPPRAAGAPRGTTPRRQRAAAASRRATRTRPGPRAVQHARASLRRWGLGTLVEQRRIDVARTDRAGPHAVPALFRVDLLCQAQQAELRGHVGGAREFAGELADVGVDVDDRPGSALAHPGQEGLDAAVATVEVGGQHRLPVIERETPNRQSLRNQILRKRTSCE